MWKLILAGAAALAIAGSSVVYAQQRSGAPERPRWQPSQEDIAAFAAARIAALRAGLVLTPEQEKNWPAYEAARQELTRYRMERSAARRTEPPAKDPAERLRRHADALSGFGAVLKKLADAQEPLYNSLDEAQKRRFAILTRPMRRSRSGHHHGMRRGMPGERGGAPGYQRRGDDGRGGDGRRWRSWHEDRSGGGPQQDRRSTTGGGERI